MIPDDHPNATAYRRTADAFRAGDLATISVLVADDVIWHVPGHHRRAGDVAGRDAVIAWLRGLQGTGFWLREHDVFGNDTHVCALSVVGARRSSVDIQTRVVNIFHFRDGQQVERWFYPEDAEVWNRIFDGPERSSDSRMDE